MGGDFFLRGPRCVVKPPTYDHIRPSSESPSLQLTLQSARAYAYSYVWCIAPVGNAMSGAEPDGVDGVCLGEPWISTTAEVEDAGEAGRGKGMDITTCQ